MRGRDESLKGSYIFRLKPIENAQGWKQGSKAEPVTPKALEFTAAENKICVCV